MTNSTTKDFIAHTLVILMFVILLTACGGGDVNDLVPKAEEQQVLIDDAGNYAGSVVIDLLEDSPKVSLQPGGRTNVVLQFVPRDSDGYPLSSDQINIELKRDGEDVSIESQLLSTANELQFDVNFGLVLDTSYSMVDREALIPMLAAAKQSIQSGIEIWQPKASKFNFYTAWFNNYIYYSVDTINKQWTPQDITSIPSPNDSEISSTKLFAATDFMVDKLNALPKKEQTSVSPTDQNIMLVFSDGKDNYSWFDNSDFIMETSSTDTGAEYSTIGYKATTSAELLEKLDNSSNLTVHVIGLGDTINEVKLQEIAKKGKGTFRKNPNAEDLVSVFDRVVQEFTTLQTHGASMSLPPGEYTFTLRVSNKSGNNFDEYNFSFTTNSEGASIVTN
ncbi:MAG: VWA domain-containing protein [Gammaproteobacteria bacterium]|nr:VWA domain-containing protein [Gammaproteobacteria bacterium]